MKKIIIIFIGIIGCITTINAQNEVDALRYSYTLPGGTSRVNAMGGSFGALGGDASMIHFNPAGMGVYKSSEFTITPGFEITNNNAGYLGTNRRDYESSMNLNNIAYIGTIPLRNDFSNINFGFAYNRLNSFNENISIEGVNNFNSITDWFAQSGNGLHPSELYYYDNLYSNLAFETYLIDPVFPDTLSYVSIFDRYGQTQRELIQRSGYQGEYSFSVSGSIGHKLFLGATLGIQTVRYKEVKTLEETDPDNLITDFKSLSFQQHLATRGSGLNFKFGFLYSPVDWIRFGGAIHTPTYFSLRDEYRTSLSANLESRPNMSDNSFYGAYDYELNTPFRANASLGFIIGTVALVNIDYDFIDYSKARLRADDYTFLNENDNINSMYKPAHNVRVGAEYRYGPVSFRGGVAYNDSPYAKNEINEKSNTWIFSGGLGGRFGSTTYIDIAYSYFTNDTFYGLYGGLTPDTDSPMASLSKNKSRITATLGFKF